MISHNSPKVSIVMVNFNGKADLSSCLESLKKQTYSDFEIVIVDNASTDGSVEFLKAKFPYVNLIETGKNLGFGAGNNVGIKHSRGKYIIFTNYDVEFDPDWLLRMITTASSDDKIGLVAPKILLYDSRNMINTCGLTFQYTGHAFSRGANKPSETFMEGEEIASVTGCAFLIKKEVLNKIGLFDEEFQNFGRFFHSSLEDIDLAWRAQLAGYKVIFEPSAVMYHKYIQKPLTPLRYYYLECGRYYILLKNYCKMTLILLFPALILSEIVSWGFVFLKGKRFVGEKISSYKWLVKRWPFIKEKREQMIRTFDDSIILKRFQTKTELRHVSRIPVFIIAEVVLNCLYSVFKQIPLQFNRIIR